MHIGKAMQHHSARISRKKAIIDSGKSLSYLELNSRANKLGNALLDFGLAKGDKVATLLHNSHQFIEVYIALTKVGMVIVPINCRLVESEIEYILNHSDAKILIFDEEFIDKMDLLRKNCPQIDHYINLGSLQDIKTLNFESLISNSEEKEPQVNVDDGDYGFMFYTSGTTGRPKGCLIPHKNMIDGWIIYKAILFGLTEHDIYYGGSPFYHSFVVQALQQLFVGGTICVLKHFDPIEALKLIEREKVSIVGMVPTMFHMMVNLQEDIKNSYDLSSVKTLTTAGSPMHMVTKEAILKLFGNAKMFDYYGSTETGMMLCLRPEDQLRKPGSIGQPVLPNEVRLVDQEGRDVPNGEVGTLYMKAPGLMAEYYKMPKETKKIFWGDWLTVGDMGRRDKEGYYYMVDRKTDMVISGGVNIYPAETEAVLYKHPKVLHAAVIGIPDEKWGEALKALIVLKKGQDVNEEEIKQFCMGKISKIKIPKSVEFVSDLPMTPSGKVKKRKLREKYWKGHETRVY